MAFKFDSTDALNSSHLIEKINADQRRLIPGQICLGAEAAGPNRLRLCDGDLCMDVRQSFPPDRLRALSEASAALSNSWRRSSVASIRSGRLILSRMRPASSRAAQSIACQGTRPRSYSRSRFSPSAATASIHASLSPRLVQRGTPITRWSKPASLYRMTASRTSGSPIRAKN